MILPPPVHPPRAAPTVCRKRALENCRIFGEFFPSHPLPPPLPATPLFFCWFPFFVLVLFCFPPGILIKRSSGLKRYIPRENAPRAGTRRAIDAKRWSEISIARARISFGSPGVPFNFSQRHAMVRVSNIAGARGDQTSGDPRHPFERSLPLAASRSRRQVMPRSINPFPKDSSRNDRRSAIDIRV